MNRRVAERTPVDDLFAMDSIIGADELELVGRVRAFVRESFVPDAGDFFAAGAWPRALFVELGTLEVLDLPLSDHAGAAVAFGLACIELGAGDAVLARLVGVHAGSALTAVTRRGGGEVSAEWSHRLRTGEAIGTYVDGARGAIRASLRSDDGDCVLTGTMRSAVLTPNADVIVVRAAGDDGPVECVITGSTPGVVVHAPRRMLDPARSLLGDLTLDGVRVPARDVLAADEGDGLAPGTPASWAAYAVLCGTAGAARAALDELRVTEEQAARPVARDWLHLAASASQSALMALDVGRKWDAGCLRPVQLVIAALATARAADDVARAARLAGGAADTRSPAFRHLVGAQFFAACDRPDAADVSAALSELDGR